MVSLGHRVGLYKAMAGAGPLSSRELVARAGCAERYVREWLNAQAAGGHAVYHATSGIYELTQGQAFVLADEDSPVFIPPRLELAGLHVGRRGESGGVPDRRGHPWGGQDGRLYCGVSAFYRNAYRGSLVSQWLPALNRWSRRSKPAPRWPTSAAATGIRRA